jgi:hypothetical protein
MSALGIRTSSKAIRLAVIEGTGDELVMTNKDSGVENRLLFPASASSQSQKVAWWYDELSRILRQNRGIKAIGLKQSEFALPRRENMQARFGSYLDAVVFLAAEQKKVPLYGYLYTQLSVNSKSVSDAAINHVGKLDRYWDAQIADAVVAGASAFQLSEISV